MEIRVPRSYVGTGTYLPGGGDSVDYEQLGATGGRATMGSIAVSNVIALSWAKAKLLTVTQFDIKRTADAEDYMSLGAPVVSHISR